MQNSVNVGFQRQSLTPLLTVPRILTAMIWPSITWKTEPRHLSPLHTPELPERYQEQKLVGLPEPKPQAWDLRPILT